MIDDQGLVCRDVFTNSMLKEKHQLGTVVAIVTAAWFLTDVGLVL